MASFLSEGKLTQLGDWGRLRGLFWILLKGLVFLLFCVQGQCKPFRYQKDKAWAAPTPLSASLSRELRERETLSLRDLSLGGEEWKLL